MVADRPPTYGGIVCVWAGLRAGAPSRGQEIGSASGVQSWFSPEGCSVSGAVCRRLSSNEQGRARTARARCADRRWMRGSLRPCRRRRRWPQRRTNKAAKGRVGAFVGFPVKTRTRSRREWVHQAHRWFFVRAMLELKCSLGVLRSGLGACQILAPCTFPDVALGGCCRRAAWRRLERRCAGTGWCGGGARSPGK